MKPLHGFRSISCGNGCQIFLGKMPPTQLLEAPGFEALWSLHPSEQPEIRMFNRRIKVPRWQQAYGVDYAFSGQVSRALPVPPLLQPVLNWARQVLDESLNGLLVNWYDGNLKHHIGPHRDQFANLIPGSPIVTISFGAERVFRLRPWRSSQKGRKLDLPVSNRSVLIIPCETNLAFTHEVPHLAGLEGRRVSVTLRAFNT